MKTQKEKEAEKIPFYLEVRRDWMLERPVESSKNRETLRSIGKRYGRSHQWVSNVIKGRIRILEDYPDLTKRPKMESDEQPQ